jgi:hypothetical protein
MQRFLMVLCLISMAVLRAHASPPLSFAQFSVLDYEGLDPYISDYFIRYPEQKGSEKIVRNFFQAQPPNVLMPVLQKMTPVFYAGIQSKSENALAGKPDSKYTLDDFLKLPESEHRELAKIVGPYLHALLTDEASKNGLQALARKEGRALEVAFMLVQMRAQQGTGEDFSNDLSQILGGLAQMRQASSRTN